MMRLFNANTIPLNRGGASPVVNAESALNGQLEPMTFSVVTKTLNPVTFQVTEHRRNLESAGSIQPLQAREIELKPEGERRWKWLKIYALPDLLLQPKDVIRVPGNELMADEPYRIMGSKNWRAKGYMYYEMVADYQVPAGYDY